MDTPPRHFAVLLNRSAGQVRSGPEATRDLVARAFHERGLDATVGVHAPEEMGSAVDDAYRSGADAVVIGGGDGTFAHAAEQLKAHGLPLGILPLGTFNLLARDLSLPVSLEGAIEALAQAETRTIDVGMVNGHTFLMHASLGLHPWLIRRRDKNGSRTRVGRMLATLNTAVRAVRHAPPLEVSFACNGEAHCLRARLVVVTVGAVERGLGQAFRRYRPNAGHLALYTSRDDTSLLRMVWDTAQGPWHESDAMDLWMAAELEVTSPHGLLPVALDGDVVGIEPPLRFVVLPQALSVLVPAADAPTSGEEPS